jgi:Cd2+/Zn2+-exporting ATPase
MKKKFDLIRLIVGLFFTVALLIVSLTVGDTFLGYTDVKTAVVLPIAILVYLFLSYDLWIESYKNIKHGNIFNEVTLSLIATIAAFCIQEYVEGLAVIVFYQVGLKFEEYSVDKSRESIKSVLNLRPDKVNLLVDGKKKIVDPYNVKIGDLFLVDPGERVPLDGIIHKGNSSLDYSSMTGESVPVDKKEGDDILSGTINLSSPLIIKSTKEAYDSTINKILDVIENATNSKTKSEKFITKFARIYTPIVVAFAFILAVIPPLFISYLSIDVRSTWVRTGASFLVISCPCALVLSVPMAYFVGIGSASKMGVIIKGSQYLENFSKIKTIVLDKTGTITKGKFQVSNIYPAEGYTEKELIACAKLAETHSNHPIAQAVKSLKGDELDPSKAKDIEQVEGKGIKLLFEDKVLLVGNAKLLDDSKVAYTATEEVGTLVYVAYDGKFVGKLLIKDTLKPSTKVAIKALHDSGVKNIYMLTGDNERIADSIAQEAGIDKVYANLLPLNKVDILRKIISDKERGSVVAFAGDGVNDAPSLATSDIGISMGLIGADAAIEASDAVVMDDDISKIARTKKLAKTTLKVVYFNIFFAIFVKLAMMVVAVLDSALALGISNWIMWLAIFADVGVTIICVLNSMTLMSRKF